MTAATGTRIGLKLAPQFTTVDELRTVWRIADDHGFDTCWTFDHFASIGPRPDGDVLDGWTLLGSMAEITRRTRIGVLVTGVTHRHPAVLAKMATTVDHLSGGRLEMGMGAAWAENEHCMLGLDFPPNGPRIDRLAEACEVLKLLWTQPRATFAGRHYTLRDAVAEPKPLQRPHPPLWIGGSGERKLLRVVARFADVWNHTSTDPQESARLSGVLDRHCAAIGRDPATIRRSAQFPFAGDVAGLQRLAAALVARGFRDLVIVVRGDDPVRNAEAVAAELPRLRELG